jgi:hypothetical protein
MQEKDNEWAKMSRQPKPSARKMILDALSAESVEEASIGKPENPVLPLVGSMNVPISEQEEKYEQ